MNPIRLSLLLLVLPALSAHAEIEAPARALAEKVQSKLASASTLRLTAKHKLDPRLGVGAGHEKGPIELTVQRPNRFHAVQHAGAETRVLATNGTSFVLLHPELKHHAVAKLPTKSLDDFADLVDQRFGFRPPLAELISANFVDQLFSHVSSAKVTGTGFVGFTRCDKLEFVQDGMKGELWVARKDQLPRRYRLTFTDQPGHPTWDIRLTQWELNPAVSPQLFSPQPAADSQAAPMLRSR